MRRALLALAAVGLLAACEDGPAQVFTPNEGDPSQQNGFKPADPWFQDGEKSYDYTGGQGDSVDRARFCDEREMTDTINTMVSKPIIPDVSMGGIPMWSAGGTPTHANDLIGRPEDGKFCDPDVYSNALTWGPTYEIIAFINEETKLIETLVATSGYLGKLEGKYTAEDDSKMNITMQMRDRVRIGAVQLDKYSSSANQAATKNSWLNHDRIVEMYKMIRESFFGASKFAAGTDDCFATQICGVIYTAPDESQPQTTLVLFRDSGIYLAFSPEGHLIEVDIEPVKVAQFETSVELSMLDAGGKLAPKLKSHSRVGCDLDLSGQSFASFKSACVAADDVRTLPRAAYDVYAARDAVDVNFNGVTLSYQRQVTKDTLFKDGERPADTDKLFGLGFYRDLNAPVKEFVPADIAALYKAKLEARLTALVASKPGHPLGTYKVALPADLGTTPEPIGALYYNGGSSSFVDDVVAQVRALYASMTLSQQRAAPEVLHPVFLIEPFVDAVLSAFTGGKSDAVGTFKGFEITNDRRWSIGMVSFEQDGVPMRLVVQYSLNYGAITAVSLEAGASQIDQQYDTLLASLDSFATYYGAEYSWAADANGDPLNPLGLGGTGIKVEGSDRKLGTVDISLKISDAAPLQLRVPGTVMADQGGFFKQVRGERFEFVPAHDVRLYGRETQMVFYVTEIRLSNGESGCDLAGGCLVQTVGSVHQPSFKGTLSLCNGLDIEFGDDLRAKIDSWASKQGQSAFSECEIVYNYSANGNLLSSVTSLANKISFDTDDGRAIAVSIWQ
ncbi:MAG TPA: hypothetical protein VGK67_15605 [Myxococcales bacterium]